MSWSCNVIVMLMLNICKLVPINLYSKLIYEYEFIHLNVSKIIFYSNVCNFR